MVKLNIQKAIFALEDKATELDARATAIKADETLSKNTRQTRAYSFRKEMYFAMLMRDFLKELGSYEEEMEIETNMAEKFDSFVTSAADRASHTTIEVHKGDSLVELLQRYQDRKDVFAKIQKACEDKGLTINTATGIVE